MHKLGARCDLHFVDLWGLDDDLLQFCPQPVKALVLLFPITKVEEERTYITTDSNDVFFMKQYIGNACGTIGLLHVLLNLNDQIRFQEGSFLETFYSKTKHCNAESRGKALEDSPGLEEAHEAAASSGESKQVDPESVDLHFLALVNVNGQLFELDGRKKGPICHGPTDEESMLKDSVKVVKGFVERNPDNLNFSMCALVGNQ